MEQIHKQAEYMRNKLRNYLDEPGHPKAQWLVKEVEQLIIDARQKKNPLSIENRVKGIIRHLESFVDDKIMDFRHRDELLQHSDNMRQALRSLS